MAEISIIIVSYNTKELTAQAVKSVIGIGEIIVVDNNSSDGSLEYVRKEFGDKIKIIARSDNAGFAVANNEGIKASKGKYVLLLNSDTIVHDDALETLAQSLEKNPKFGIVSARLLNKDSSYQPQGGALPTLVNIAAWWLWPVPGIIPGVTPYQDPTDPATRKQLLVATGWVGGTAMMIRRDVIDAIGMLDEKIFMYAEDVDYCIRAQKAGYQIGIVPAASITHLGSASGNSHRALLGEIQGLLYLFGKYHSWQRPFLRVILWKGALLRLLLFGILYRDVRARSLYVQVLSRTLTTV